MNEAQNNNLLYAIQTLGAILEEKDFSIQAKAHRIETLEKEVDDYRKRFVSELGSAEQYESTIREQNEYIKNLEAKIYDLEERISIMTESEAPTQPEWYIDPPAKDVPEVTNITIVIEGEAE